MATKKTTKTTAKKAEPKQETKVAEKVITKEVSKTVTLGTITSDLIQIIEDKPDAKLKPFLHRALRYLRDAQNQ